MVVALQLALAIIVWTSVELEWDFPPILESSGEGINHYSVFQRWSLQI